jgi:hypothetical protein
LVTSLLDPFQVPAATLITGYHERWEIELVMDEVDTHQRLLPQPFRSRMPAGVVQEFYGIVIAHYALRTLMADAAATRGGAPTRLSFTRTARLLPAGVLLADLLVPATRASVRATLLRLFARHLLPPRRDRSAPRARKRSTQTAHLRTQDAPYQIQTHPPFLDRVTVIPP